MLIQLFSKKVAERDIIVQGSHWRQLAQCSETVIIVVIHLLDMWIRHNDVPA